MRTDLPTGTVTFLVSDIEGSTRLLHELGPVAYARALAEHRQIVRAACRAQGGIEVDTQGDAFLVVFPTAAGALGAASALTAGLAGGPVQVRVGLHTGAPLVTDEGYVGEVVHVAARIASAAHGGQVLASKGTRDLLETPALTDLGAHRLKDIADPLVLYQLGDRRFPPLRSISNTNLPRPASSFVGRERELADAHARLAEGARLLTLTGPGGSGKTRLAIELATALVPGHRAGVFWVGLAAIRDPVIAIETIGRTIGANGGLAEHLGDRDAVLLLDNLEQVIELASDLARLLAQCPNLTLIVTSRELLRIRGEVEYRVPPLASAEAVDLFCERSRLAPSAEIAALCARLDDLPLAVELAAARTTALTPSHILERIGERLDLLQGGRDSDPRQRTLRTTIEWSYDLLSASEQVLFRRLGVFAGSFELETAETIADAGLDTLQSLVEKSLVRFANGRFRMLETIREFAAELLDGTPEGDDLRTRHAEWVTAFVESGEPELDGADQEVWLARFAAEHDEIRAALAYARGDLVLRVAGACATFWWVHGHWTEGRRWLDLALAQPLPQDAGLRAKALEGAAHLAMRQLDGSRALGRAEESLALRQRSGDESGIARSLRILGLIASVEGDSDEFRRYTEESAAFARRSGDDWALSMALNNLGYIALQAEDPGRARDSFEEALGLARGRGDRRSESFFLENLALASLELDGARSARPAFVESLLLALRLGFVEVEATDLVGLAAVAVAEGDHRRAAVILGGAQRLLEETGGRWDPVEARVRARTVADIERHLGLEAVEAGLTEGRGRASAAIVDLALAGDPSRQSL